MTIAVFNVIVALLLGFGAVQEFVIRGVRGGEIQPFFVGLIGTIVSLLLAFSGIAMWRRRPNARRLVIMAAIFSIVFHLYAWLPPHQNVGLLALIIGAGYGSLLLLLMLLRGAPGVHNGSREQSA